MTEQLYVMRHFYIRFFVFILYLFYEKDVSCHNIETLTKTKNSININAQKESGDLFYPSHFSKN